MPETEESLQIKARERRDWSRSEQHFNPGTRMRPAPDNQLKTVYDVDGVAYHLESVDAREYLETGRYFKEAPEPKPEPVTLREPVTVEPEAVVEKRGPGRQKSDAKI